MRLVFDDFIDPAESLATMGVTLERLDGQPGAPAVSLFHEDRLVALRNAAAVARDSAAAAARRAAAAAPRDSTPRPDSAAPRPDSAAAAPAPAPAPQELPRLTFVGRAQGADSTFLGLLDPPLTLPSHVVYAELADSLQFGVDYVIRIQGMPNVAGVRAGLDTIRVSRGAAPAARPPARPPGPDRRR